jgi:hypothetical protein
MEALIHLAPDSAVRKPRNSGHAMPTVMLFAAVAAILPALLDTPTPMPVPLTRAGEDVQAAAERAE